MKKLFIIAAFLIRFILPADAQTTDISTFEPSTKYGKPTDAELAMTTYAADTAAEAVVLFSKTEARYELVRNEFRLVYTYHTKIKVLKPEGTSYANVTIPYYDKEGSGSTLSETVAKLDATAYNLENGQVVRTKMKDDDVFEERADKRYMQKKFSVPGVREGSVFEYKYMVYSDFYYTINRWNAQRGIPVILTQYDITIPEYFQFNIEMKGSESLHPVDEAESLMYTLDYGRGVERIMCSGRHLGFVGKNLPALRADSYVWCIDDYRTSVGFELRGIAFPGAMYKSFTTTWENIDKMLLDDSDFGGRMKMGNPFKNEMASLGLDKMESRLDKIAAIYTFLKKRMSWNGSYALFSTDVKKAVKNGTGSNADINFVLMSMLRDAHILSYPAVMSSKDKGTLPITHPSVQKFNTFVVGIADTDSTYVFLDGSVTDGYINVLPGQLMVDQARMIGCSGGSRWLNLSNLGKNRLRAATEAVISADGKLTGSRQTKYSGQYAAVFRKNYREAKDSTEFVSKIETEDDIVVKKFSTSQLHDFSDALYENFDFEKQLNTTDSLIYVNPLIFLHRSKNPFTQAERKLPLEFPFIEQIILATNIQIPDGYVIDEMPQPMGIATADKNATCRYFVSQNGNRIVLNYVFSSKMLFYLANEYQGIKDFWDRIVEKNNDILVLKKK